MTTNPRPLLPNVRPLDTPTRNTNTNWQNPPRFIPTSERAEKTVRGLYFLYDQPFERGHKCVSKGKQLFLVEVLEEGDDPGGISTVEEEVAFEAEEGIPQI